MTAYEVRIGDWSPDVCSSDLVAFLSVFLISSSDESVPESGRHCPSRSSKVVLWSSLMAPLPMLSVYFQRSSPCGSSVILPVPFRPRSEEHTSELQSLMRISYAVFCLKKKKTYYILHPLLSTPHTNY